MHTVAKKSLKQKLRMIKRSFQNEGVVVTFWRVYSVIVDHMFDLRYGIETRALVSLSDLTINSVNKERGTRYQPARLMPLRKFFNRINSMIPPDSILVDFGSGKGRVLLAALEFNFREVRGLEFAHELCEIAKKNYAIYNAKKEFNTKFKIIECDVTNYTINTDENIFFINNPFDGEILEKVLCNISDSLHKKYRKILIIYHNAEHPHVIEKRDDFSKLQEIIVCGYTFIVYSNRD